MKIALYPEGDRTLASSRLRVYAIGDALEKMGHEIRYHAGYHDADVMLVQKKAMYGLTDIMRAARQLGVRVIWDCDDWIANGPVELADAITVDTPAKRALYPGAVVIPDALDVPDGAPCKIGHRTAFTRAVWFGGADNIYFASEAAEACRRLGIELTMITHLSGLDYGQFPDVSGVQWRVDSVDAEIVQADVALCPYTFTGRYPAQWINSKSANRVLKAWGLGLPVAGTPIPSYVEIGVQYQATTVAEWIDVLKRLQDPTARRDDAARGWKIAQQYRADQIAVQWVEVMRGEAAARRE